jgi:hypothetical protein
MLAGVPRVDYQVSKTGVDSDHFCRNDNQPGDTQRDPQTYQDLGKRRRQNYLG